MKQVLLTLFLAISYFVCFAQSGSEEDIKQILQKQTEAWNRGDIDAFMQTYWKSDSLIFVGKNGVTYGWQNTLNNYKKNYKDTVAMGRLEFNIIKIEPMSPDLYNVIGQWHLTRSIGDLKGHYTLIIKKIDGNWLIVQDHSS